MKNGQLVQTAKAVGSVVTPVIAGNSLRNYLCIQNVGTADLQIGFDSSLTSGNGTTLSPGGLGAQGGFFVWERNFIPTNPIYAISATGSKIVVLEG